MPSDPSAISARYRQVELPAPVAEVLTRYATITRRLMIWEAAGWFAAAVVGAFVLLALADHWLVFEDFDRRLLAVFVYAAGIGFGGWMLWRALRRRDASQIALGLEKCASGSDLEERISTTVELAQSQTARMGLSPGMIDRVAGEAAELARGLKVDRLPDRTPARRAIVAGLAVQAIAIGLAMFPGWNMPLQYVRVCLPWANVERLGDTRVVVLTGDVTVVEGQLLSVEVRTEGERPKEVFVESRETDGPWERLLMDRDPSRSDAFTLKLGPLHVPIEYRAKAADAQSPIFRIAVLPRPEVTGFRVAIDYPAYTRLPSKSFSRVNGDLAALKGSEVEVQVTASTGLAAAVLEFSGQRTLSMKVEGRRGAARFTVEEDTGYRVRLRSKAGVGNPDAPLYFVRALEDRPPRVSISRPEADQRVRADAMTPLEVRGEDDLGVKKMRLVVQTELSHAPMYLPLERPEDAGERDLVWLVSRPWDLAALFLNEGESVTFHVEAFDAADLVGRSDRRRLRIMSDSGRQEHRLLRHFERVQKHVSSARTLLAGARDDVDEMRQVFRAEDPTFQAAERLLLSETFHRVAREARAASEVLAAGLPHTEPGSTRTLVLGLRGELARFAETGMRPIENGAERARRSEAVDVAAGLDVLATLLPDAETKLKGFHEALTAGHRCVGAEQLANRAIEVHKAQARITPALVGAAGWTPHGMYQPGLMAHYCRDAHLKRLFKKAVDVRVRLPDPALKNELKGAIGIRWTGQILAPATGTYTFRVQATNVVRLSVAGKRIIDRWKRKSKQPDEATVELAKGWHDIELAYAQRKAPARMVFERSGPGLPRGSVPKAHLRTVGIPISPYTNADVRAAMANGSSDLALSNARIRLRTLIENSRALPRMYEGLAKLEPDPDSKGAKEAQDWARYVEKEAAPLLAIKEVRPELAIPMMAWGKRAAYWAGRYEEVARRYRLSVSRWAERLGGSIFDYSPKLRQLESAAGNALKAFKVLTQAAAKPKGPERDRDAARADANLRALAEDLRTQARDIADQMKAAFADIRRPRGERRAFLTLAQRAEDIAWRSATQLDRHLAAARTPGALAESGKKSPNFATHATDLKRQAGALARDVALVERVIALRDALSGVARDLTASRKALDRPDEATRLRELASRLVEQGDVVKRAVRAARELKNPGLDKKLVKPVAPGYLTRIAERLQRRAAELRGEQPKETGKHPKKWPQSEDYGRRLIDKSLQSARAITSDIAGVLDSIAEQDRKEQERRLREASERMGAVVKGLKALKKKDELSDVERLAAAAEAELKKALHTAERLASQASAMTAANVAGEQRDLADDMVRLAASIRNDVELAAEPVHAVADLGDAGPVAVREVTQKLTSRTEVAAEMLKRYADIMGGVASKDAEARDNARLELFATLEQLGLSESVDRALNIASGFERVAGDLDVPEKETGKKPVPRKPKVPDDAKVEVKPIQERLRAATSTLDGLLRSDEATKEQDRRALGQGIDGLKEAFRGLAEQDRKAAKQLELARGRERRARGAVKREAADWRDRLRGLAGDAKKMSKSARRSPLSKPLASAVKMLEEAAVESDAIHQAADEAPVLELSERLDKMAESVAKPMGMIVTALGKPEEKTTQTAQEFGKKVRDLVGRQRDAAVALKGAERAGRMSRLASGGTAWRSAQLHARVAAAVKALEKEGLLEDEDQTSLREAARIAEKGLSLAQVGPPAPPSIPVDLARIARQRRVDAHHAERAADALQRVAQIVKGDRAVVTEGRKGVAAGTESDKTRFSPTSPVANARRALAEARAAHQLADKDRAEELGRLAAGFLRQASDAVRGHAAGMQVRGAYEARRVIMDENWVPEFDVPSEGSEGDGGGSTGDGRSTAERKVPDLPKGLPIDQKTWNRLPDDLRRDLLNAAGGRFPPEFEGSIRRYFKNVASMREEERD